MAIVLRIVSALFWSTLYKLATNAYFQALVIALHDWRLSLYWLAGWWVLVIVIVSTGETRNSRLPGLEHIVIRTARRYGFLLGDEQQGWLFPPDSKLPRWLLPYVCCGWRNKLRNIAFWRPLKWLHVPRKPITTRERKLGRLLIRVRTSGWMTEAEYFYGKRFGDFGPRLDQPSVWGGVSWAWRPWGRSR